jgi:ATP-binding cassette subfamily C protein
LINNQDIEGQVYRINPQNSFLLDHPQKVWIIQSGKVSLFAVTVSNDSERENHRYLFDCTTQDALFGTTPSQGKTDCRILAVPNGEVEILLVDRDYLEELVVCQEDKIDAWLQSWLDKFNDAVSFPSAPKIQTRVSQSSQLLLDKGQILQPESGKIIWIDIEGGHLRWLGREEFTLTKVTTTFPLNDRMWLEADETVRLQTKTTNTLPDADALLTGLSQLHKLFLDYVLLNIKQQQTEELQRLNTKQDRDRQVTITALDELAFPLTQKTAHLDTQGEPLMLAAEAVGRALEVVIRPPASSENLKRLREPLEAIARASRLRLRQVLLRDQWWQNDCGPLVAYTLEKKPVALLPVTSTRYELFDPIAQTRTLVNAKTVTNLDSVAYMFYRSLPDRVLNIKDILQFAFYRRSQDLWVIFVTGIIVTLLGMLVPYATGIIIDHAIPDSNLQLLWQIGSGLLISSLAIALFGLTQGFSLLRVETASDVDTQSAVWDRLLNLPVAFFRQYTTGDLQSRVTSIGQIRTQLGGANLIKLASGLFTLLNLVLLAYYSPQLALVATILVAFIAAFTIVSGTILIQKIRPLLEIEGNIFGQTVQLINGIAKLKVAGAEARAFAFWSNNYSRQIKLELSTQLIEDLVVLFNTVMPTIVAVLIFWFASNLLSGTETGNVTGLSVGTFIAFNTAFQTLINSATKVSNTVTDTLQVIPQWQRARPIVKALPEVTAAKVDPGKLTGKIEIKNLSFRYQADKPLILEDINIVAEAGDFIALVGDSGSGKSTIFRLLLGFETPETGTIYYDDRDLLELDVHAVRRQLGVVLQTDRVMSGSILENLAGGSQISIDEAWWAVEKAGLADDIQAMPMGIQTVISEGGSNLSGGQRQRLLIAKALILKPKILLFDEATSALDNKTQAIVTESLTQQGVTRIAIAHRHSTISNADCVYILQKGKVRLHNKVTIT